MENENKKKKKENKVTCQLYRPSVLETMQKEPASRENLYVPVSAIDQF